MRKYQFKKEKQINPNIVHSNTLVTHCNEAIDQDSYNALGLLLFLISVLPEKDQDALADNMGLERTPDA